MIFSASTENTRVRDFREGAKWTLVEERAKKRLENRCMVLADADFLRPHPSSQDSISLEYVERELSRRKFQFSEETECEVWGAPSSISLPETARRFSERFEVKSSIVSLKTTGDGEVREDGLRRLRRGLRGEQATRV